MEAMRPEGQIEEKNYPGIMKDRQAPKQWSLKENIFMKDSKGKKVAIYRYLDKDEAFSGIDQLRKREL